jgi:hypothetical protein
VLKGWKELAQENIHIVADAIPKLMTNTSHTVEPGEKFALGVGCQIGGAFDGLLEHAYEHIEVRRILMAYIVTESSRLLAVENHQLHESLGITDRLFLVDDCPLGSGYGRFFPSEYIRPPPTINGLLVWLKRVFAQTEAGMKKRPIALIRSI